ncbi:MAG: hypothetical protein WCV62_06565, partial [Candidatus Peribacteraceae bacterium]
MKAYRSKMIAGTSIALLVLPLLSHAIDTAFTPVANATPAVNECKDGIDNDGDGKIDALVELDPNNGQTKSWYADSVGIRAFYNQVAAQRGWRQIPTAWDGQGMVSNDSVTADKICEIAGYSTVASRSCPEYGSSGRCNFTSCNNNTMGVWKASSNNMKIVGACGYTWIASLTCKNKLAACSDGIDNDGDGKVDMEDPGCASINDDSEVEHDPGCQNPDDPTESTAQCSDGIDNDGDGAIDFPADFSCSSSTDNDETLPKSKCQDGVDNDGDGLIDYPQDPGCVNNQDNDEGNPIQCSDGIDNDNDGATDYPNDFSCTSATDNDE